MDSCGAPVTSRPKANEAARSSRLPCNNVVLASVSLAIVGFRLVIVALKELDGPL